MTKGIKSSEFYITLISLVCGLGMAIYGIESGEILAALSIPAAYVGGRSAVKAMNNV
jgi:hypothetical protein